jgi:hypothetical protein
MYISLGSPRMSNQDNNFTFLASILDISFHIL